MPRKKIALLVGLVALMLSSPAFSSLLQQPATLSEAALIVALADDEVEDADAVLEGLLVVFEGAFQITQNIRNSALESQTALESGDLSLASNEITEVRSLMMALSHLMGGTDQIVKQINSFIDEGSDALVSARRITQSVADQSTDDTAALETALNRLATAVVTMRAADDKLDSIVNVITEIMNFAFDEAATFSESALEALENNDQAAAQSALEEVVSSINGVWLMIDTNKSSLTQVSEAVQSADQTIKAAIDALEAAL